MTGLFDQLKRRRVFRTIASYLVVAWLVVQVVSVIGPPLGLTDRFMQITLIVLVIGFPISLIFSWFFSVTTHGISRESDAVATDDGRSIDFIVIGLLATALVAALIYIGATSDGPRIQTADSNVLAVLPLTNLSSQTPDNGFVAGLHHDLLGTLSQLSPLKVISRTSVLGVVDTAATASDIGSKLGANKILEGSVQLANEMIHISITLIDVDSDSTLWSNTYEEQFNARQLFALQRDIALAVANELKVALSLGEDKRLEQVPTRSTDAYRNYLLGQLRTAERTSASLEEAIDYFEKAIELDAQYAEAYAALALAHNLLASYSNLPVDEMRAVAMPLVQRALELNAGLSDAHVVLADLRDTNDDRKGAEAAYKEALRLNPNNALAHHWYGIMLLNEGRHKEALDQHLKAQSLDPLSPIISVNVAQDYVYLGDIDAALAEYNRTLEIKPDFVPVYAHLASLYGRSKKRPDEAVRWLRKAWDKDPGHTEYPSQLSESLLDLGDADNAGAWADIAFELGPTQYWPNRAKLLHATYINDVSTIERHAAILLDMTATQFHSMTWRAKSLIDAGDTAAARRLFLPRFTEFMEQPPRISSGDYPWAVLFGYVLQANGEHEQAAEVLRAALEVMRDEPRSGFAGVELLDVAALGLLGETGQAMQRLEEAKASNWSTGWWLIRRWPLFENLRNQPQVAQFEQDLESHMQTLRTSLDGEAEPPLP